MKFKDFVNESLTSPVRYKFNRSEVAKMSSDSVYTIGNFNVEGRRYRVFAERKKLKFTTLWYRLKNTKGDALEPYKEEYIDELYFDMEGSVEMTGTGDAGQVLSTVFAVMKDYMKVVNEAKILGFFFTADEPSRKSLYAMVAKRLSGTQDWNLILEFSDIKRGVYFFKKGDTNEL